uniref:EGF-like domain-containing protein n=1 Tax=Plectus sambesii TaxID=2011161 RepID=A0A914W126_9BILA
MKESVILLTLFCALPLNSEPIRCLHGQLDEDGCECDDNYYGTYCETMFNCKDEGNPVKGEPCDACKPHWSGHFCDIIECGENGKRSINVPQTCLCDPPYTGQFCTALNTSDVYRFYNKRVSSYIPLGVLIIIPTMVLILICNFWSQRRQTERINNVVKTAYLKQADVDDVESMKLGVSNDNK